MNPFQKRKRRRAIHLTKEKKELNGFTSKLILPMSPSFFIQSERQTPPTRFILLGANLAIRRSGERILEGG